MIATIARLNMYTYIICNTEYDALFFILIFTAHSTGLNLSFKLFLVPKKDLLCKNSASGSFTTTY